MQIAKNHIAGARAAIKILRGKMHKLRQKASSYRDRSICATSKNQKWALATLADRYHEQAAALHFAWLLLDAELLVKRSTKCKKRTKSHCISKQNIV